VTLDPALVRRMKQAWQSHLRPIHGAGAGPAGGGPAPVGPEAAAGGARAKGRRRASFSGTAADSPQPKARPRSRSVADVDDDGGGAPQAGPASGQHGGQVAPGHHPAGPHNALPGPQKAGQPIGVPPANTTHSDADRFKRERENVAI
jgi:hypothetical protein